MNSSSNKKARSEGYNKYTVKWNFIKAENWKILKEDSIRSTDNTKQFFRIIFYWKREWNQLSNLLWETCNECQKIGLQYSRTKEDILTRAKSNKKYFFSFSHKMISNVKIRFNSFLIMYNNFSHLKCKTTFWTI